MSAVAGHAKGGPPVRRGDPSSKAGAERIVATLQRMNPGRLYEVYLVDAPRGGERGAIYGVREVTSAAVRRSP